MELVGVVLQVPTVAQDDERRTATAQVVLTAAMFVRERHLCGRGVDDAGVYDPRHAPSSRSVDGVAGVIETLPDRRRRDRSITSAPAKATPRVIGSAKSARRTQTPFCARSVSWSTSRPVATICPGGEELIDHEPAEMT